MPAFPGVVRSVATACGNRAHNARGCARVHYNRMQGEGSARRRPGRRRRMFVQSVETFPGITIIVGDEQTGGLDAGIQSTRLLLRTRRHAPYGGEAALVTVMRSAFEHVPRCAAVVTPV